ncbi:hypothetical protein ABZP36_019577 [Zizania latifolia]
MVLLDAIACERAGVVATLASSEMQKNSSLFYAILPEVLPPLSPSDSPGLKLLSDALAKDNNTVPASLPLSMLSHGTCSVLGFVTRPSLLVSVCSSVAVQPEGRKRNLFHYRSLCLSLATFSVV